MCPFQKGIRFSWFCSRRFTAWWFCWVSPSLDTFGASQVSWGIFFAVSGSWLWRWPESFRASEAGDSFEHFFPHWFQCPFPFPRTTWFKKKLHEAHHGRDVLIRTPPLRDACMVGYHRQAGQLWSRGVSTRFSHVFTAKLRKKNILKRFQKYFGKSAVISWKNRTPGSIILWPDLRPGGLRRCALHYGHVGRPMVGRLRWCWVA